jgi:hypothetical protein
MRHFDQTLDSVGQFVSRVIPVSPRLSPEAGNVTGTGFGAGPYARSHQRMTVAMLDLYFADTAAVAVGVTYTLGRAARQTYHEVQNG